MTDQMKDDLARVETTGVSVPARTAGAGRDYLITCRLDVENEIREKPQFVGASPWVEYEFTGRRFGTLEAEIANCSTDPYALLSEPTVFEWPGGRMFLALQITHVERRADLLGPQMIRTHIRGRVLGIAQYDAARITESEARRRLGMPPVTAAP